LELGAKYHDRRFAITKAVPARHGASSNAAFGGGLFAFNPMSRKKIPLVQLVLESFEFSACAGGIRYKIRPRHHFRGNASWAFWNQKNAGRPASKCMSDENGIPYYFIEIAHPLPWETLFLWQERVEYILKNKKDHPRGDGFGGFFKEGGMK